MLDGLTPQLDHDFADPLLLQEALTHASAVGQAGASRRSNERLEFLGDRVLGLIVAELLYDAFPREAEGALARRYAALVRRDALARVAEAIDLGAFIRLSRGEEEAGGRRNPGLLADTCEAVIAAVYLDGGLPAARAFIRRHWWTMIGETARPPKDSKTALQEWAQARGLPLPRYREIGRAGPPHAPTFSVEVTVEGLESTTAGGASKRVAEQAAAETMLARIHDTDHAG
ncbi:MAG: ribonuclease III [Rhodospirillales bacterium]|nr:MAG: ribonuclease III [Rhodospirillales bacterium]